MQDKTFNDAHIYSIGGWNVDYLNEMHRIKVEDGSKWEKLEGMKEARSDMACQVIQYQWSVGILVAGGYKLLGAWTPSIEFFNFDKGKWASTHHLPRLNEARHYNGLTTIGLVPVVFGGWSNGATRSAEELDFCHKDGPKWVITKDYLLKPREKFTSMRVPRNFESSCIKV